MHRLGITAHEILEQGDDEAVGDVGRQLERAVRLVRLPVPVMRPGLDHIRTGGRERRIEIGGERRAALHEVIRLHCEDATLRERDRLLEVRPVEEMEDHATVDARAAWHLIQVAMRQQGAGGGVQLEKAVHHPFDKSHGNALRLDTARSLRRQGRRQERDTDGNHSKHGSRCNHSNESDHSIGGARAARESHTPTYPHRAAVRAPRNGSSVTLARRPESCRPLRCTRPQKVVAARARMCRQSVAYVGARVESGNSFVDSGASASAMPGVCSQDVRCSAVASAVRPLGDDYRPDSTSAVGVFQSNTNVSHTASCHPRSRKSGTSARASKNPHVCIGHEGAQRRREHPPPRRALAVSGEAAGRSAALVYSHSGRRLTLIAQAQADWSVLPRRAANAAYAAYAASWSTWYVSNTIFRSPSGSCSRTVLRYGSHMSVAIASLPARSASLSG